MKNDYFQFQAKTEKLEMVLIFEIGKGLELLLLVLTKWNYLE
jgi:hypothetical protein